MKIIAWVVRVPLGLMWFKFFFYGLELLFRNSFFFQMRFRFGHSFVAFYHLCRRDGAPNGSSAIEAEDRRRDCEPPTDVSHLSHRLLRSGSVSTSPSLQTVLLFRR